MLLGSKRRRELNTAHEHENMQFTALFINLDLIIM